MSRPIYYLLHDDKTTEPTTMEAWAFAKGDARRAGDEPWRVGRGGWHLPNGQTVTVSTVFLGIDHADDGPPILFETMVFWRDRPDWDDYQERYGTWAAAEAGHARIVRAVASAVEAEPAS